MTENYRKLLETKVIHYVEQEEKQAKINVAHEYDKTDDLTNKNINVAKIYNEIDNKNIDFAKLIQSV